MYTLENIHTEYTVTTFWMRITRDILARTIFAREEMRETFREVTSISKTGR